MEIKRIGESRMLIIKLAALFNFVFGVFHLFFWKLLKWEDQLKRVSLVNKAVVQTLNICLTFIFLLIAYIFFFHSDEILTTSIGRVLLLGMALFWSVRVVAQLYFFNLKERIHQFLLLIFVCGIVIHIISFFYNNL